MLRHLSATSLRDFLTCPFKGKLAHIDRLRLAKPKAILAFGTAIHYSIEKFYRTGERPMWTFRDVWEVTEDPGVEYIYTNGDTYNSLLNCGSKLMQKFPVHPDTPIEAHSIEKARYCEVGVVPFWSVIDYTGDHGRLLLDWKTSSCKYPEHKVKLDLQLTAYAYVLAVTERMPERVGFGVFIKKKEPEIQYLFAERTRKQLKEFENLCEKVWFDIQEGHFPKIPGNHCSMCDYTPICLGEDIPEGYYITMPQGIRKGGV